MYMISQCYIKNRLCYRESGVMNNVILEKRNSNIGTLHLIAALFVMYGHHCALLGQASVYLFNCKIQSIGVKTIFLISGYLITKSLWEIKANRAKTGIIYAIKRLGRLYPEYFMCILFTTFVIAPIFTELGQTVYWNDIESIRLYIVSNLLLYPIYWLPGVFASNRYAYTINGSFWTMPVEIALYLIILLIFLFSKKESVKKAVYAIVTALILGLFIVRFSFFQNETLVWHGTDWFQALDIRPYFLIGGTAWLFRWSRYMNFQVGVVLLFIFVGGTTRNTLVIDEMLCMVVLSYFVLSFILKSEQDINLKYLKSEYSYGIYLYGFVIQQCIVKMILPVGGGEVTFLNFHLTYVLSVLITYCLAGISYKWIYLPSNALVKKVVNKLLIAKEEVIM